MSNLYTGNILDVVKYNAEIDGFESDGSFNPTMSIDEVEQILDDMKIEDLDFYKKYFSKKFSLLKKLGSIKLDENDGITPEAVVVYEIIYNLYKRNFFIDDILDFLERNGYRSTSIDGLTDFILNATIRKWNN